MSYTNRTIYQLRQEAGEIQSGRPRKYGAGYVFGQLTILDRYGNRAILECSCGNIVEVSITALVSGGKNDCGHVAAELAAESASKRGDMLYWTWHNMIARCHDQDNPAFPDYGARGVIVCDSWHIFENFKSDMGTRPHGMTLDRMNPNGNYEPSNCRWATPQEQAMNKRNSKSKLEMDI